MIAACFYNNLHLFDIRHTYHVDFVDIFQLGPITLGMGNATCASLKNGSSCSGQRGPASTRGQKFFPIVSTKNLNYWRTLSLWLSKFTVSPRSPGPRSEWIVLIFICKGVLLHIYLFIYSCILLCNSFFLLEVKFNCNCFSHQNLIVHWEVGYMPRNKFVWK